VLVPQLLQAEPVVFNSVQSGHACWIAGIILSLLLLSRRIFARQSALFEKKSGK
jgi:hypothetical protein